jgi:hypothetical protein
MYSINYLQLLVKPAFFFSLSFRKYPKKMQPSFYQVTHHSKERPDVWVDSPEK